MQMYHWVQQTRTVMALTTCGCSYYIAFLINEGKFLFKIVLHKCLFNNRD